jgi:hypothetical protein
LAAGVRAVLWRKIIILNPESTVRHLARHPTSFHESPSSSSPSLPPHPEQSLHPPFSAVSRSLRCPLHPRTAAWSAGNTSHSRYRQPLLKVSLFLTPKASPLSPSVSLPSSFSLGRSLSVLHQHRIHHMDSQHSPPAHFLGPSQGMDSTLQQIRLVLAIRQQAAEWYNTIGCELKHGPLPGLRIHDVYCFFGLTHLTGSEQPNATARNTAR